MWGRNLIEGILKVAIFLLYLIFCSRQKDIYRVFQYNRYTYSTRPSSAMRRGCL